MPPLLAAGDAVVTLSPVATEDHGSTDAPRPDGERHRPTGLIVLCGLLLIAVVGLAVWAFSAQSDADDAQAKLDAQQRAAAAATPEPAPEPEPAQPAQVDPETQQKFEELAQELGATGESIDEIEQQLEQASAKVDDAEQAREDAAGVLEGAKAEAEAFKAQFELTKTCLRGTLDAVTAAYAGGNVDAAVQELEQLSGNCRSSASP